MNLPNQGDSTNIKIIDDREVLYLDIRYFIYICKSMHRN